MRLSTIFELLLIFLFLAFAASRTIHGKKGTKLTGKDTANQNRYCQCTNLLCNCCRDFSLPVVSIKGPGCASVAYLNDDAMRLTMTFGDKVLRNITLAGKRPNPVCMPLPGGVSKFCGRVYGITRDGDHFKACLALELRSLEDLEAALRVSCFRFGPEGVKLEPGKPVPPTPTEDEDDDDDYGFSDDDDDDDDDDDFGLDDDDDDDEDDDEAENDVDSGVDYTGFSILEGIFGESSSSKKKPKTTTSAPKPVKVTKKPIKTTSASTVKLTTPTTPQTTKAYQSTTEKIVETTEIKSSQIMNVTSTEDNEPMLVDNEIINVTEVVEPSGNKTAIVKEESDSEDESDEEEEEEEEEVDETEEEDESTESSIIITNHKEESETDNKESNNVVSEVSEQDVQARQYAIQKIQPAGRGENITPEETERLFPGLTALIRPPSHTSYSFPPVRSARTHKRMRLPPIES